MEAVHNEYGNDLIIIIMGKNKYIETPELMWQYFLAYVVKTKQNPLKVHDFVGKDGRSEYRLKEKPLTIEGFELYCYNEDIIGDLSHYFANTDNKYSDYLTICSRIRKSIRDDQIAGGMAGIYNPSITQRLNNLVDKTQTDIKIEQPLFNDEQKKLDE